jgi:hypothetical protein
MVLARSTPLDHPANGKDPFGPLAEIRDLPAYRDGNSKPQPPGGQEHDLAQERR